MKFSVALVTVALLAVVRADDIDNVTGDCTLEGEEPVVSCDAGNKCITRTITETNPNSKKNKPYESLKGKDPLVDLGDVFTACYADADADTMLELDGVKQADV